MDYKVVVTQAAQDDLDRFIQYLLVEKRNPQAAKNVLDDFDATVDCLRRVAGSLKLCEHPNLSSLGYRRINFLNHLYFILYRIKGDLAIVNSVFHVLQDYETVVR